MQWQAERSRITEPALAYVLQEITNHRREKMSKDEIKELLDQDMSERKEILNFVTTNYTQDLCETVFRSNGSSSRDIVSRPGFRDVGSDKAAEAREGE
jgi:hypothetical protein